MLDEIKRIADRVKYQCDGAEWYKDPNANEAFASAVVHEIDWLSLQKVDALIAALQRPEIVASGRIIAKEVRRTEEKQAGIFGLTTRALMRPAGNGDDQSDLPDEAAQIFQRTTSDAAAELRRAGARPHAAEISGEETPQSKVAKDHPVKEGIAKGRSTKRRRGKRR